MNLTEAQKAVLELLSRRKEHDCPPTGPEISEQLGHAKYWAAGKLSSLDRRGFAERLGQSLTGGNCFQITDAGRRALEERS
jgi:DNA-binding MarR family transcriptional regulator